MSIEIEQDAQETYSFLLNIFISWQSARYEGRNQARAIRDCAKRLSNQTSDELLKCKLKSLAKEKRDHKVLIAVGASHAQFKGLGWL